MQEFDFNKLWIFQENQTYETVESLDALFERTQTFLTKIQKIGRAHV